MLSGATGFEDQENIFCFRFISGESEVATMALGHSSMLNSDV
jgi:hypothetical protein